MAVVRQIEDISLVAEINRSPQTVVYRGYQESTQRCVLVKVLTPQFSSDPSASQSILKEARLISRIKHPNVVSLYSCGESTAGNYIVTEFIDGLNLAELLARKPLPPELAWFVLMQTAQGLRAAHKQNVLHRDIKPSNIMISNRGEVKLTDFGMASPRNEGDLTEARGTLPYLAPEQILGQPQDCYSDIFSLGATFYEMLAGLPAFQGETVNEFFQSVLNDNPTAYLSRNQAVPDKLVVLCKAMLDKKSQSRIQDCDHLVAHLLRLQKKKLVKTGSNFLELFVNEPESYRSQIDYLNLADERPRQYKRTAYGFAGFAVLLLVIGLYAAFRPDSKTTALDVKKAKNTLQAGDSLMPPPIRGAPAKAMPAPEESSPTPRLTATARPFIQEEVQTPDTTTVTQSVLLSGAATEPSGPGFLDITCIPWSYVYIDDDSIGMTPLQRLVNLAPGRHRITFKNPNFPAQQTDVAIAEGETQALQFSFWATVGRLKLDINPWAEVYIDNQYKDTIPPQDEPIVLSPGSHLLTLKHPTLGEWQTTIELVPAKTLELQFNLRSLIPQ